MNAHTDLEIKKRFESGQPTVESLIAPLIDLATDSSTLILGYGLGQSAIREEMIPYFHICGTRATETPVRALIVGGWVGTETVTPLAIAHLISAMESRLQMAEGIEVTAYPVANLEAYRQNVFLTDRQKLPDVRCWDDSRNSHVLVLENELRRYDYDIVILLRQNPRAQEADLEAWLSSDQQKAAFHETLARYALTAPNFRWKANPVRPVYARTFTPIPESNHQPAEIIIGLPGALSPAEQSSEARGLILSLLHAVRQARQQGAL